MQPTLVILAAGMGSRYGGLKQVDGVGPHEEAIIEYSIYDAIRAGFGKVVFIIRKDIEQAVREKFAGKFEGKIAVDYVFQEMDSFVPAGMDTSHREKPWGTAHAMLVAKPAVNEPFAVINADDYYGVQAFKTIHRFLTTDCAPDHHGMVGYILRNTMSDHGTVNRGVATTDADGNLATVVERLKIAKRDGQATYLDDDGNAHPVDIDSVVSMNFWGFHPAIFERTEKMFHDFVRTTAGQPKSEFLIPEVVDEMIQDGSGRCSVLTSNDKWYGVTYQEDKPMVVEAFRKLVAEGVYPERLWS
ncbi:MAG: nucleotidyltransferase [Lewinella sp.]|nr:nucleotidyltransferase [Lewinella sp.]